MNDHCPIIIYQGRHFVVPLMAAMAHLGLKRREYARLAAEIRTVSRADAPMIFLGRDEKGMMVGCLRCGRHSGLYSRALTGMATVFGIGLNVVDMDEAVRNAPHGGALKRLQLSIQKMAALVLPSWSEKLACGLFDHVDGLIPTTPERSYGEQKED